MSNTKYKLTSESISVLGMEEIELSSNCCGAGDIYDGNLDNNEGVCADCGEHCEMEEL